jgi:membrane-associated phospholipid phosphatase
MKNIFEFYLYNWGGGNQALSQKIHSSITNNTALEILKFFTEYVGKYKLFPIHLIIISLIMLTSLFIKKNKISKEHFQREITKYFQLLATLIVTILCVAIVVGTAKEIFTFTRPLCSDNFILHNYGLQYKLYLENANILINECNISFPSGHSAYITAMLVVLWSWLLKPIRILGIFIVLTVSISRVALGMHYLSDVVFAVLASTFIAISVKHVMHAFFAKRTAKK